MKLAQLTPNLMVADVNKTIEFYQTVLGFSVRMAVDREKETHIDQIIPDKEYIWAQLVKDDVEIMVQKKESLQEDIPALASIPIGASISLYILTQGVDELYEGIKGRCDCVKELGKTWYQMKEFYIRDIDGYILGFAEQQEV